MASGDQTFGLRLTDTAKVAYLELLDYFLNHYSMTRANELAESLLDAPLQLMEHPCLLSHTGQTLIDFFFSRELAAQL